MGNSRIHAAASNRIVKGTFMKVGDKFLVINSDWGLYYFVGTVQTVHSLVDKAYITFLDSTNNQWAARCSSIIPLTELTKALV